MLHNACCQLFGQYMYQKEINFPFLGHKLIKTKTSSLRKWGGNKGSAGQATLHIPPRGRTGLANLRRRETPRALQLRGTKLHSDDEADAG